MMNKKKAILGLIALVAMIAVLAGVYIAFGAKPTEGSKSITIEVVNKAQESKVYELDTDAEYLRQAMEEAGIQVGGKEDQYGIMVDTINGERADYTLDGAYWGFNVNGSMCNYGIDTQPVLDGDAFQVIYTPAELSGF